MTFEHRNLSELIAPVYYPIHRDIRQHGHVMYWLKGGRGSGKSSFASTEIVQGIMRNPKADAVVFRKVQKTLRKSVYEQIIWAINMLGVSEFFRKKETPMEITYRPTGQQIIFLGLDDAEKTKSLKSPSGYFGYLWFEELSEFKGRGEIDTTIASVVRGGSEPSVIFATYNPPETMGSWVNADALRADDTRLVHSSTYLDLPKEWLGSEFIRIAEAMKKVNERSYRHRYLGEVTGTGGQVFENIEIRAVTDTEIGTFGKFYNGLDFGFAVDPDAFVRWAYDPRTNVMTAIDEYYSARTPTDRLAEEIRRRGGGGAVYCDSADPRMIDELTRRGIRAIGAKKGPGSVEHGMRWLQDAARIVIDPRRTPNIAREFTAYEYKRARDGESFLPDYPDENNHAIDATRYALEERITARKLKSVKTM